MGVLLSVSVLVACGAQSNVLPASSPNAVAAVTGPSSQAPNGTTTMVNNGCQPLASIAHEHTMSWSDCFSTPPPNPCVVSCDGPTPVTDPCMKNPKLPSCGGSDPGGLVACSGTPTQCADQPCFGSPASIGSTFQFNYVDVTVTDINSLWQQTAQGSQLVGWIYKGDNGARYIQGNLSSSYGISWSVNAGLISIGVSPPSGVTPIQHYSGTLPHNTGDSKCETRGGVLA